MSQYRIGRVAVTNDSDIVIGTDTDWLSNASVGDIFLPNGDEVLYRVSLVVSDTELWLNARYAGTTRTNANYSLTRDFTPNLNLPIVRPGDVDAVPIFAEGFILIDAQGLGGGGGGATTLDGLLDVSTAGSQTGHHLVKLAGGTFGFAQPETATFSVASVSPVVGGGDVLKSFSGGVATLRRIKVNGGSLSENVDDLTINIPSPGETNTLSTIGTAESVSLVAPKSGTQLRAYGLRPGTNMAIVREGNDIVFTSTATSSGGGTTHTLVSVGTGQSLVAPASGGEFRIRSVAFESAKFTTTESGGTVNVALKPLAITDISTVQWNAIADGQVLVRDLGGSIIGANLPQPGISALSADPAPQLGGNLILNGRRIIGLPVAFHGMYERPKAKSYIVCFSAQFPMTLTSIVVGTAVGTVNFRVDIGPSPVDTEEGEAPVANLQGAASPGRNTVTATSPLVATVGDQVTLTLFAPSADVEDFYHSIIGESA